MPSIYHINIRKEGRNYVLFNHDEIAGSRLFKGNDMKNPKGRWPFSKPNWNTYPNRGEAFTASVKLQGYLEFREKTSSSYHTKKEKKP